MLNKFKSVSNSLNNIDNKFVLTLTVILMCFLVVFILYGTFWCFVWAIATLFNYTIAFTFWNWLAFMFLVLLLKGQAKTDES